MNLYLDTSALVKLYITEEGSDLAREGVEGADVVSSSAMAYVEARAAFARRRRIGHLSTSDHRAVVKDLDADWRRYFRMEVADALIREAAVLAERHHLRAYDAIHLASARRFKSGLGGTVHFACWDEELERAAQREGLVPLRSSRRGP